MFVFGDFNVHHKDWLTYSGGTDRSGELCYNFSTRNDLTQMVNFPTRIPHCNSQSPALLDLFISPDASNCSTLAFSTLENSDHVVVSVSIDLPSNSQRDAPFHRIAYDYSRADWDGLGDHLRDVPNSVLLLLLVNFESGFRLEFTYISLIVSIRSNFINLHGFSTACAATIVHRNHFFRLHQQSKSSESKVKFRQAISCCKRVLEAAKFAYANKTKESITSRKLGSRQIANSALNKS